MEREETTKNDTAKSTAILWAQSHSLRPRSNSMTGISQCSADVHNGMFLGVLGERNDVLARRIRHAYHGEALDTGIDDEPLPCLLRRVAFSGSEVHEHGHSKAFTSSSPRSGENSVPKVEALTHTHLSR